MRTRSLSAALLLAGAAAASSSTPAATGAEYRLGPQPASPIEAQLRETIARSGFSGPSATADALRALSAANPGTPASGLAQLAAGLLLLDAGRPAEALPPLQHADVAKTALADYALYGRARALEGAGDAPAAGAAYVAAADAQPSGPLACLALLRAGEVLTQAGPPEPALAALSRALETCAVPQRGRVLYALGLLHEKRGDRRAAAAAYDRLAAELPASAEAPEAMRRLAALGGVAPAPADTRAERTLARGLALFDAQRYREAASALREARGLRPPAESADLLRVRLGRALLALKRVREGEAELAAVQAGSPHFGEAAYHLARSQARRTGSLAGLTAVADAVKGSPWGEEALLELAADFQKDNRADEAVPYYARLLAEYPDGRYVERATWRVAWAAYRAGRFDEAAQVLERALRTRPPGPATSGFLYWAGRAHRELGHTDRARQLFEEAVRRYKNTYHGAQARQALAALAVPRSPTPVMRAADAGPPVIEGGERARQLLLIDRLDEAADELRALPPSPRVQATLAWLDWRRGRLRPAITGMKRAFPEWAGEAGDDLPEEVWRILFPLEFAQLIQQKAAAEGLDPALVAALVCQESTFDPQAVSAAGARGLMQILPKTGRTLARTLKVPYRSQSLLSPGVSLDFGTRYLHEMLDRFGGRVERALAAYNAGPHRVEAWTRDAPEMSAEEFIESIPFTETRGYVLTILGNQQQYRRLYGLGTPAGSAEARREAADATSGKP